MDLGAFSISLAVKDLAVSIAFYEKLGFSAKGGGDNWKIMSNGDKVIGLFQGMFDSNIMTFNPGWNQDATNKDPFEDVREIEAKLRAAGVEIKSSNTADNAQGPAHVIVADPDGNTIMFDQHR